MKTGPLTLATTLTTCLIGVSAQALTVLVDEDFESYNTTSDVNAVWIANGANGQLVDETFEEFITVDDLVAQDIGARAFPQGGQGFEHLGLGVVEIDLAALNGGSPLVPTSSQSIVVEGDIFDVGGLGNKRMSIGLRSNSPANIIELGQWNDPAPVIGYAHRGILFPGTAEDPNPNWQFFTLNPALDRVDDDDTEVTIGDIGEAWATYRAIITETEITYEIDLFRDGKANDGTETPPDGVDASITYNLETTEAGYDSLRIGSPSGSSVSSAGNGFYGGVIFDNVKLSLVDNAPSVPGDFDDDGDVDIIDFGVFADNFGLTGQPIDPPVDGDFEPDGDVDIIDFGVFADNFGTGVTAVTVPEPTAGLLALSTLSLAFASRRC